MASPNTVSRFNSYPQATELPVQPAHQLNLKKKYELSEIEQKCLEALNKRLMSLANLQSYAGACQASDSFQEEQGILFKMVKRSKYFENEKIAAANAMGILNQTDYSFSRKKLRKVRIPGAYLEGANLVGTDFQGADLTGVILTKSVLNYALFSHAQMKGVRLGQQHLARCNDIVNAICFTQDKKKLIACTSKEIYIWDLGTGKKIKKLKDSQGRKERQRKGVAKSKLSTSTFSTLTLFPDGKRLASGGWDHFIRIWNIETGQEIQKINVQEEVVIIVLSSDGKRLISGYRNIRIWDLERGREIRKIQGPEYGGIKALAIFPDEEMLASGGGQLAIRIWNMKTGRENKKLEGHTTSISSLASFSDGRRLASGSWDATVRIWDIETGEQLKILAGHTRGVTAIALFHDGEKLASGSQDKTIRIWDVETGEQLKVFAGHTGQITTITLFPDGEKLASGGWDRTIRIWDLDLKDESEKLKDSVLRVSALAFQSDVNLLAFGKDRNIYIWNPVTTREYRKLIGHTGKVTTLALFLQEVKLVLISGSQDKTIRIWDMESGNEDKQLTGHTGGVTTLTLFSDGKKLASGSQDKTIRIWDIKSGNEIKQFTGHMGEVSALAVFSDGKRVVSGSKEDIKIWSIETCQEIKKFDNKFGVIYALSLISHEKRLILGWRDSTIQILDIETGEQLKVFKTATETFALFSNNSKLAFGSYGTISISDLKKDKGIIVMRHPVKIALISLKNDQFLCIVDEHGGLWMWNLHMNEESIKPELLWTTNPSLSCDRAEISQAKGLSEANRQLMVQLGAK